MDAMCEHATKIQKEYEKIRKRSVGTMINEREMRQKRSRCNRNMIWNLGSRCEVFRTREISKNVNEENVEITNNVNVEIEEIRVSEGRSIRIERAREIKMKGGVTKTKDEGMTRLFSVNCNVFGSGSSDKIDQVIRESESKNVDGIMISSSHTR